MSNFLEIIQDLNPALIIFYKGLIPTIEQTKALYEDMVLDLSNRQFSLPFSIHFQEQYIKLQREIDAVIHQLKLVEIELSNAKRSLSGYTPV